MIYSILSGFLEGASSKHERRFSTCRENSVCPYTGEFSGRALIVLSRQTFN